LSAVQEQPEYRAAQIEVWKQEEALHAAQADPHGASKNVASVANQLLEKRAVVTKMQADQIRADTDLRQARYAALDAQSMVEGLRRSFNDSVRFDRNWQQAQQRLNQARQRLVSLGGR